MARSFRLYGKKLGNRRTGSEVWGQRVLGLFFAVCYLVGCGLLAHSIHERLLPEWRVVTYYRPVDAAVIHARVAEHAERGTRLFRPEFLLEYPVGGRPLQSWSRYDAAETQFPRAEEAQAIVDRFPAGQTARAWFDPLQPTRVVLFRGFRWLTALWLLIPSAFLAVGGGGLALLYLRTGRSREEQALVAQAQHRLSPQQVLKVDPDSAQPWPQVPSWRHLCNSPGTKLAWRLPALAAHSWRLATLAVVTVAVNVIVAAFVFLAVLSYLSEEPDWRLTAFAMASTGLGVGLIVYCLRAVYLSSGWGSTIVEVSELPLRAGRSYSVYVSQGARGRIRQFQLLLVCEEQAAYRQGTDTRLATQCVVQQEIVSLAAENGSHAPLASAAELRVPDRAMHSFVGEHNSVHWRLVARGEAEGWPALDRTFPIVVAPEPEAESP